MFSETPLPCPRYYLFGRLRDKFLANRKLYYHPIEYFYTRRIFAFNRTHTIYVVFHSRGFYDVPRVFIVDARSFQTHLTSMSFWYRSDARQDEFK